MKRFLKPLVLLPLLLFLTACLEQKSAESTDNETANSLTSTSWQDLLPAKKMDISIHEPISSSGSSIATIEINLTAWVESEASTNNSGKLTVQLGSTDPSQITISPSSLDFTSLNYDVRQTVTVTRVPNFSQHLWQSRITASAPDIKEVSREVTFSAWNEINSSGSLKARQHHAAIWTGSQICVWGGSTIDSTLGYMYLNSGECYSPSTKTWTPMTTTNAPRARQSAVAVWTGTQMCVWGGYYGTVIYPNSGSCYNPATDTWSAMSASPLGGRYNHIGVWTGNKMCIWGGHNNSIELGDGACYSPSSNTWNLISSSNAPTKRTAAVGVWTGSQMCLWGGRTNERVVYYDTKNDGGCYSPATNSWVSISTINAPIPSSGAAAVWTGSKMCVWGGLNMQSIHDVIAKNNGGGCYDPTTDLWAPISTSGAPAGVTIPTAVWTGSKMCVWGGYGDNTVSGSGSCYDPSVNQWVSDLNVYINSPQLRGHHIGIWTGSEMCIWGGTAAMYPYMQLAEGACIKL